MYDSARSELIGSKQLLLYQVGNLWTTFVIKIIFKLHTGYLFICLFIVIGESYLLFSKLDVHT